MLKRIYVNNYKCLVNFELNLQELTHILGPNGSGKTSVLDVVFALRQLLRGSARVTDRSVFPTRSLTRWQTERIQVFEIEIDLQGEHFVYRIEIEHEEGKERARIALEHLTSSGQDLFRFEMGDVQLFRDDGTEGPTFKSDWSESALARVVPGTDNKKLTRFLEFIGNVVVCSIDAPSFNTETEETEEDAPLLNRDARNFSTWFRRFLLEYPKEVSDLTVELSKIFEDFEQLRLEKVGLDTRALMVRFKAENQPYDLRFDEISDGQRALIALYALARLRTGIGYTLFIDEPANYVSIREIQPWLAILDDDCGEAIPQAVLCSHHPETIDYLGHKHSIMFFREKPGVTRSIDLSEHVGPQEGNALKLSELVARGWLP